MPTIKKRKKKINKNKKKNYTIDFPKFYNSSAWKHLRSSYKLYHPLCEECLHKGIVKPAEHVHHIIPFSTGTTEDEQWKLLLDPNNLQSLCRECHEKKHEHKFQRIKRD